ncbi:hypothetical protein VCV18_000680 [Metarhizium anisopliae]
MRVHGKVDDPHVMSRLSTLSAHCSGLPSEQQLNQVAVHMRAYSASASATDTRQLKLHLAAASAGVGSQAKY